MVNYGITIGQILNFRYHKKFSSWDMSCDFEDMKHLKRVPAVFNNFKLSIHHHGVSSGDVDNNHVFCVASKCDQLDYLLKTHNITAGGILVVAGEDDKLSRNIKYLRHVKNMFRDIYYEAKDVECDWVQSVPMGVNLAYLLRSGGSRLENIFNSSPIKDKLIGGAFGSKWPHLTDKIDDRKKLKLYIQENSNIHDIFSPPEEFFYKLSSCQFFTCPLGNGVQTPKIFECLLCETVPIVTSHIMHHELKTNHDIPLVIVNQWNDIDVDIIDYDSIDWSSVKKKLTVDYFTQKYLE